MYPIFSFESSNSTLIPANFNSSTKFSAYSLLSSDIRDKEDKVKYYDDDEMWDNAESQLREILEELGVELHFVFIY